MSSNIKKLINAVMQKSQSEDWDIAKQEWECVNTFEEDNNCACGHHIINNYVIKNTINNNELIVGSTCVNKFGRRDMDEYVKKNEKRLADLRKEAKLKEKNKSLSEDVIRRAYNNKKINEFEYKFYNDIRKYNQLSEKQTALKKKIEVKINGG